MIYSIDGNIVSIEGNLFERKVKSLTFQVATPYFPYNRTGSGSNNPASGTFYFDSSTPNSFTIFYGDGTFATKTFVFYSVGIYRAGFSLSNPALNWSINQHQYLDGYTGDRNVVFNFENPKGIVTIEINDCAIVGAFPAEVSGFLNLGRIWMLSVKGFNNLTRGLDTIEDTLPQKLDTFVISNVMKDKSLKISDTLFASRLSNINIGNAYNLSDPITSSFFKINQLRNTVRLLSIGGCNISVLPESLAECYKLSYLDINDNEYTEIPLILNQIPSLNQLLMSNKGGAPLTKKNLPVWNNLQKLSSIYIGFKDVILTDIPNSWKYLYSLNFLGNFIGFIHNNTRFVEFIDNFYDLCTVNGSIVAGGSQAPYTNRFRNIGWGSGSLAFTGTKIAPAGYVQGVSNGTPANQGEKVYVLQNQYNHTITHA